MSVRRKTFTPPHAEYDELDLGSWTPATTSDKWFWFTVTGKNGSSTGYTVAIDYILLVPQ